MHENFEENLDKLVERPLECGECKKPISVHYTEIVGRHTSHTCMCSDCPELCKRLKGMPTQFSDKNPILTGTGLACGNCGTTLEALRVGADLGCSECYTVFEDVLLAEMAAAGKLPHRLVTAKKSIPIHIGRNLGEIQEIKPSMRLLALNEALNETLKKEDYEQAASLRDQIKALTKESGEKDEK